MTRERKGVRKVEKRCRMILKGRRETWGKRKNKRWCSERGHRAQITRIRSSKINEQLAEPFERIRNSHRKTR